MGLFCKGLHCAGCGKGIPLSVVVVLILIATRAGSAIGAVLAECLIAVAACAAFAMVATPLVLWAIMRNRPIMGGRWEGQTIAEKKAAGSVPEWPNRPAITPANPFLRIPVEVINERYVDTHSGATNGHS